MNFHEVVGPKVEGWTPVANRVLNRGGANAWYVLDNAIRHQDSFASSLRQELIGHSLMPQLEPAKTMDDVKTNDLLRILKSHPITSSQFGLSFTESNLCDDLQPDDPKVSNPTPDDLKDGPFLPSSVRGDRSVFMGRETTQASDFTHSYPCLSYLLRAVEFTLTSCLTSIEFDASLTSIQLAEYPGDGVSGYPRHCDQNGGACRLEQKVRDSSRRRMLTAIYYLTPDDWDVDRDGGWLRLFSEGGGAMQHIAPFPNRLVVFRSDGVEHQVLPSLRRPRLALTIWMYGRLHEPQRTLQSNFHVQSHAGSSRESSSDVHILSTPRAGPPPLPINDAEAEESSASTIFVAIPSFRDPETGPTLRNLMATARYPSRVFVGLVLQLNTTTDDDRRTIQDLLPVEQPWYAERVRVLTLDARHANGPCPARALCQLLHRGEDYVLSIDSHMRFRSNWDSYLIQQLLLCNGRKSVLTTYPVGYQLPNHVPNETRGTRLEPWKFDHDGMFRQKARFLSSAESSSPIPTHLFAAGFNFARSSVLSDCPYQNLPHLFFGEEISMAVRLFVYGYDLYAPVESVCYHLWSRSYRPSNPSTRAVESVQQRQRAESMAVVQAQLTRNETHAAFNKVIRDVSAFGAAVGVEFQTRTISPKSHA